MDPYEALILARTVGFGSHRDARGADATPLPRRVIDMWNEAVTLCRHWEFRAPFPAPPKGAVRLTLTDGHLLKIGTDATAQIDACIIDIPRFLKSFEEIKKKAQEEFPIDEPSHVAFMTLDQGMRTLRENHAFNSMEELEKDVPNPLADLYKAYSFHTSSSLLANDAIDRVLPAFWKPTTPPNCLGNATLLVAVARSLGLRFLLATSLQAASYETRQISIEALERALRLVEGNPVYREKEYSLKAKLAEKKMIDPTEWMYHHFVLIEFDQEKSDWGLVDTFLDASTFLKGRTDLSSLAEALAERSEYLPGLAVPISIDHGQMAIRRRRFRNRVTRAERHFKTLTKAHAEVKRRLGGWITLSEFAEAIAGTPAEKSFVWLAKRVPEENPDKDSIFHKDLTGLSKELASLIREIKKLKEEGGVDDFIGKILNHGILEVADQTKSLAYKAGHPSMEVYANPEHALGILITNAASAEHGFSVLQEDMLSYSTSQVVWREVGPPTRSEVDMVIRTARKAADSFIGIELPESKLHPLVRRQRRLNALK